MFNICRKKRTDDCIEDLNIYTGLDDAQLKAMEEDLKEVEDNPEYEDIEKNVYNVLEEITDQNITEPYLQQIYLGNTDEAIKELHIVRQKKQWKKEYEHDILMAFWFAIDMQNIELANKLINWDLSIRYIAILAIKGLKERPKNFKVRH